MAKLPVTHEGLFSYAPSAPPLRGGGGGDLLVVGGEGGGSELLVIGGEGGGGERLVVGGEGGSGELLVVGGEGGSSKLLILLDFLDLVGRVWGTFKLVSMWYLGDGLGMKGQSHQMPWV